MLVKIACRDCVRKADTKVSTQVSLVTYGSVGYPEGVGVKKLHAGGHQSPIHPDRL